MAAIHSKRVMFKSPLKVQEHKHTDWVSANVNVNSNDVNSNDDNVNANTNANTNNFNSNDSVHLFKTNFIMSIHQDSMHELNYDNVDNRKQSQDSGVDNPFLPGSELEREADIIVQLIKEGKPITPTKEHVIYSQIDGKSNQSNSPRSPNAGGINGTKNAVIDVQHGIVVPPNDASQVVEQVVIKKKHKCCAIQ